MSTSTNAVRLVSDSAMPAGVRVSQLQPALGSIVSGFRFDGRPLDDEFRSALRDLLHNRGLVIFEPGTVTAENFTAFAGFLGEFFHYAGPHTPRAPENPDATMINSLKDKNLRNHIWHADGGFRPDAPAFTALFAHLLPESGGDTIFSNTAWVYEQLDPLVRRLSGIPDRHSVGGRDRTYHRPLSRSAGSDQRTGAHASLRDAACARSSRDRPEVDRGERILRRLHQGRQQGHEPEHPWHPV